MTPKKVNKLQEIDSILDASIGVSNAHTTTPYLKTPITSTYTNTRLMLSSIYTNQTSPLTYQPTYITIGKLKLTQEEYETCMRYLLEITKQAKPEEFI